MMFTTNDGRTLGWVDGQIVGDPTLVERLGLIVDEYAGEQVATFDWWGAQTVSLEMERDAYVTIGWFLAECELQPIVDVKPKNPAGYEPEGPVF